MSRSSQWRRTCSDAVSWHQDEALSATMYILREIGPTGFLLKDGTEEKKVRVLLGDAHSCTCSQFSKEHDLCKHICWILLKKFRVPRHNPVTWQLGLVEREINELLRGITAHQETKASLRKNLQSKVSEQTSEEGQDSGVVPQREINEDDVCPVCQDELLKKHEPVTYCRFGCGKSLHIKCMTVWAKHQLDSTGKEKIECPFCRGDFGPFSTLQAEMRGALGDRVKINKDTFEHTGVVCKQCHVTPIVGKCYRCVRCSDVYLCQTCFNTATHDDHPFHYRQKPTQKWSKAPARNTSVLPEAIISNLMERDISDNDYDLLLQLDNNSASQPSDLTEATVSSLPLERVRHNGLLLAPGQQCRVCLRGYKEGDTVRRLPCRHKFHRSCIDDWLIHRHQTCPIDGIVYTNDSIRLLQRADKARRRTKHNSGDANKTQSGQNKSSSNHQSTVVNLELFCISINKLPTVQRFGTVTAPDAALRRPPMASAQLNSRAMARSESETDRILSGNSGALRSQSQGDNVVVSLRQGSRVSLSDHRAPEERRRLSDIDNGELRDFLFHSAQLLDPHQPDYVSGRAVTSGGQSAPGSRGFLFPSNDILGAGDGVPAAWQMTRGAELENRFVNYDRTGSGASLHYRAMRFSEGASSSLHARLLDLNGVGSTTDELGCTASDLLQIMDHPAGGLQRSNSGSRSSTLRGPAAATTQHSPSIPSSHTPDRYLGIGIQPTANTRSAARNVRQQSPQNKELVNGNSHVTRLRLKPLAHVNKHEDNKGEKQNLNLFVGLNPLTCPPEAIGELAVHHSRKRNPVTSLKPSRPMARTNIAGLQGKPVAITRDQLAGHVEPDQLTIMQDDVQTNIMYTSDDDSDHIAAVSSNGLSATGCEFRAESSHDSPNVDDNDAPDHVM